MRHELDSMASAFNEVHRELSTVNDGIDSVLEEIQPVRPFGCTYCIRVCRRIIGRQDNLSVGGLCEIAHPLGC